MARGSPGAPARQGQQRQALAKPPFLLLEHLSFLATVYAQAIHWLSKPRVQGICRRGCPSSTGEGCLVLATTCPSPGLHPGGL